MAGVIARNASFSFRGLSATVTGISVEAPTAAYVDMTHTPTGGVGDRVNARVLVPTLEMSAGSITVDFLQQQSNQIDPNKLVGLHGQLSFLSNGYGVIRQAFLESASTEVRVGELVRGTLKFKTTDYYGR
jgi:hypothetical protein